MLGEESLMGYLGRVNLKGRRGKKKRRGESKDHKVFCFGISNSRHYRIKRKTTRNSSSDNQREKHFLKTSD